MHHASEKGFLEVVELLVTHKANVNATTDGNDLTPLHFSVLKSHPSVTKYLMANDADLFAIDKKMKNSILHMSVANEDVEMIRLIVDELEQKESNKLNNAEETNSKTDLQTLLDMNDEDADTSLLLACKLKNDEIVQLLIEKGSDVIAVNKQGETTLHLACKNGCFNSVKLICNFLSVNVVDRDGKTPLHVASSKGKQEIVQLLIDKEALIEATDNSGSTPLHLAVKNGEVSTVKCLLENGANVNAQNNERRTVLHLSVLSSGFWLSSIRKILLSHGADQEVEDIFGKQAKQYWDLGSNFNFALEAETESDSDSDFF